MLETLQGVAVVIAAILVLVLLVLGQWVLGLFVAFRALGYYPCDEPPDPDL